MITNGTVTGVLLINLGTPAAPEIKSVRAYLREFLNDPYVIDLPAPLRRLLVHGFILPFRPKSSAHAYRQIWMEEGSPLLYYSKQLAHALAKALGSQYEVALGMRYGQPSIESALTQLQAKKCHNLLILPLFPQYSSATTESAIAKTLTLLQKLPDQSKITVFNSFFDHSAFIEAWKALITEHAPPEPPEVWVFSYHGLPVRQLQKRGCHPNSCDCNALNHSSSAASCYKRQCFATTERLAQALSLKSQEYRIAFQSRLGRTPWITPYTDHLLTELASQGVKRLAIACPSFVVDCLETLEEIGIRARQQWQQLGGTQFTLLPCLNSHEAWVNGLKKIIQNTD